MDYTKNLKLSKPSYDDDVDIKIINTNMDMLDDNISNLNYLPLTGGTVTGNTEITGTLTNNGKDVGKMFNGSANIEVLLDWDKMKEVYGSIMTSTTTIYKGESKTITYPNWCNFNADLGIYYFSLTNKDLYLIDDFTSYDEVIFQCVLSGSNTSLYPWKSKVLECMFENHGYINVSSDYGCDAIYHGFYQYGEKSATDVSTRRMLKYYDDSGYIANVYGVKYARN